MLSLVLSPIKLARLVVILIGTFVRIRREGLVGVWLGLELNLYGFLVVINPDGHHNPEPCIKYFVVQRTGSILILRGFLFLTEECVERGLIIRSLGVLLKSGVFPLHS